MLKMKVSLLPLFGFASIDKIIPADTRRVFNVYKTSIRRRRLEVFCNKRCFIFFPNFTGKHLRWSLSSLKGQSMVLSLCDFWKHFVGKGWLKPNLTMVYRVWAPRIGQPKLIKVTKKDRKINTNSSWFIFNAL